MHRRWLIGLLGLIAAGVLLQPLQAGARQPQSDRPAVDCRGPGAAAGATLHYCRAEQTLESYNRSPREKRRPDDLRSAAQEYRRAADLTRDDHLKTAALERLADMYDEHHLDEPATAELVLREIVRLKPDDLTLHFRIARLQEKMALPDAAEGTLLNVRYLHPAKHEVYRELAAFYARRTSALFAERTRERMGQETPGQPDEEGVYRVGGGMPPPTKVQHVAPEYPQEAVAAGIQGMVIAEIVVDEQGLVRDATIVRSIPLLDDAALAAVRRWQFKPAVVNGRAVPIRMTVTVNFTQKP